MYGIFALECYSKKAHINECRFVGKEWKWMQCTEAAIQKVIIKEYGLLITIPFLGFVSVLGGNEVQGLVEKNWPPCMLVRFPMGIIALGGERKGISRVRLRTRAHKQKRGCCQSGKNEL